MLKKRNVRYPSALKYDDDGWIVSRGRDDLGFVQTETLADALIGAMNLRPYLVDRLAELLTQPTEEAIYLRRELEGVLKILDNEPA